MKHYLGYNLLFVFFHFLIGTNCFAQSQEREKLDSLLVVLKNYNSECKEPCISDSTKVNLLNLISWAYKFENPDSALYFGKDAIRIAEMIYWPSGRAQSYHQVASCYNNIGDYTVSIEWYLKALHLWEEIEPGMKDGDLKNILTRKSKTLGNMAAVYDKVNFKTEALECYLKALKIDEELENKDGIATKLGNIGTFYYHENQFTKALEYLLKSLKMDEQINNLKRMGANLGNTGLAYWKLGGREKALQYHLKALAVNEGVGNKNYIARDLGNLAIIYDEQGNYELALFYYFKALKIKTELGDKSSMAGNLGNIGSLYQTKKEYAKAESYLIKSIKLADEIHELAIERDNLINLSKLYEQTGKPKLALQYYKKILALNDSLFNEEKTQEITRKEMNYEFGKREALFKAEEKRKAAIALSEIEKQKLFRNVIGTGAGMVSISAIISFLFYKRKRDAEQLQKETALSLQVSETEMKALRSQMNPHFIFNALQSIQTFLMSHQSEEANTYLLKFSKLMRAVLENSQHREVPLQKDMQALELYMQLESIRLPHPFTYEFHIDETIDVEEVTIPPLILQPFVENAIWHGLQYKTEPGHINIYLSKIDNSLHAIVEDNGVGRDMNKLVNQPMLLKKESLGMKLTEERLKILNELKKIKAQFKITDLFTKANEPAGTRVELSLPIQV